MTTPGNTTISNDGPFLKAATRLMIVGLTVMILALLGLYFIPAGVAPFVSLGLYGLLLWLEHRHGVLSPVTALMTVFYLALLITQIMAPDILWAAFAAPAVYFLLAALVWGLLIARRPFTNVYSNGSGFVPLHNAISVMWGSLHLAAGLAALALMPHILFLIIPLLLMLIGVVGTLVLNFVTMGPRHGRQKCFQIGKFTFRQVRTDAEFDIFYATIAEAYRADLQRASGLRRKIDKARIEAEHRASDAKRSGHFIPFLAYDGKKVAGGICVFLDHRELGLPVEHEAMIALDACRSRGGVAEMGRLGVLQDYRLERCLLPGLFKCVIEVAAERRIHTIVNDSFAWQVGLYSKIGFSPITDAPYVSDENSTGYGLSAQPLALDLAGMVLLERQNTTGNNVREILNDYVIERFFKVLALQELYTASGRKSEPGLPLPDAKMP